MTAEVTEPTEPAVSRSSGGVQSLDRAFAILEAMADAGGMIGLSQLAEKADLPLATIHRLVRTLVDLGYVRQEASRQYSLGPRLMRLSDNASKRVGALDPPGDDRRGGRAGGVGQPGHPRRRRDRLRRAGAAVGQLHADVHRGRAGAPARTPPRSARRSSRPSPTTRSWRCSSAPACRATRRPRWGRREEFLAAIAQVARAPATPSTRGSRRSACAASPWRCPTLRSRWRSRCRDPPRG